MEWPSALALATLTAVVAAARGFAEDSPIPFWHEVQSRRYIPHLAGAKVATTTNNNGNSVRVSGVEVIFHVDNLDGVPTNNPLRSDVAHFERDGRIIAEQQHVYQNGEREGRHLQNSCLSGDPFYISSTVYPTSEGCYEDSGILEQSVPLYTGGDISVGTPVVFGGAYEEEVYWVAGVLESVSTTSSAMNTTVSTYCVSVETVDVVGHPAGASWICNTDGDSDAEFPTALQFSVACGCGSSGSSAPTTTATTSDPSVPTSSPSRSSAPSSESSNTCSEGDAFSIDSSVLPDVNGCYASIGTIGQFDLYCTGLGSPGDLMVSYFAVDGHASISNVWALATINEVTTSSSGNTSFYSEEIWCWSQEDITISAPHPTQATWACQVGTDTSDTMVVSSEEFAVECGCDVSSTPTSTTTSSSPGAIEATPTPASVPSSSPRPEQPDTGDGTETPSPATTTIGNPASPPTADAGTEGDTSGGFTEGRRLMRIMGFSAASATAIMTTVMTLFV